MNLEEIVSLVHDLDENCPEGSDAFNTAIMLLAALEVGANPEVVAEFTGLPLEFVQPRATRLEKAGIWKDGGTYTRWADGEIDVVAFWLDQAVAEGYVERVADND